jgi:hypothetical protein
MHSLLSTFESNVGDEKITVGVDGVNDPLFIFVYLSEKSIQYTVYLTYFFYFWVSWRNYLGQSSVHATMGHTEMHVQT